MPKKTRIPDFRIQIPEKKSDECIKSFSGKEDNSGQNKWQISLFFLALSSGDQEIFIPNFFHPWNVLLLLKKERKTQIFNRTRSREYFD